MSLDGEKLDWKKRTISRPGGATTGATDDAAPGSAPLNPDSPAGTHSALSTSAGLPSTDASKSAAPRSGIGSPLLSMTCASTTTRETWTSPLNFACGSSVGASAKRRIGRSRIMSLLERDPLLQCLASTSLGPEDSDDGEISEKRPCGRNPPGWDSSLHGCHREQDGRPGPSPNEEGLPS